MAKLAIGIAIAAFEIGTTIYRLLNQPHLKQQPLQDQFSESIEGNPIAFGYGIDRVAGGFIWEPGIKSVAKTSGGGCFGGPKVTTYTYFGNFAVAFCEGPARIRRVWFDSKIVYDPEPGSSASYRPEDYPLWSATETYNPGNVVAWSDLVWQSISLSTGVEPGSGLSWTTFWEQLSDYPAWNNFVNYGAGDVVTYGGQLYVAVQGNSGVTPSRNGDDWKSLASYYPAPTIYKGDETQLPDPVIQSTEGAAKTPAFRGMCYAVWENFPLANFGNRVPNVRAEIIFDDANGPAVLDQGFVDTIGPDPDLTVSLTKPIQAGDFLIAVARWRHSGAFAPTIADDAPSGGNTWTPAYANNDKGIWYCDNAKACSRLNITANYTGSSFAFDAELFIIRVSGQASYAVAVNSGSGGSDIAVTSGVNIFDIPRGSGSYTDWVAALFLFADALGNTLKIGVALSDNSFTNGTDGTVGVPDGYQGLFPYATAAWAKILTTGAPKGLLSSVVLDICERAGLATNEVDVTKLTSSYIEPTDVVSGYAITDTKTAAEILRQLMIAFLFDGCESDGVLRFVPRGLDPVMDIPEEDLGLVEDKGAKLNPFQIMQEQDLPQILTVTYRNPGKNYQPGKQEKARSERCVSTRNQQQVDLALVLSDTQAAQLGDKTLFLMWLERDQATFKLWRMKYILLDTCDVVTYTYNSKPYRARIPEATVGQGLTLEMQSVRDNADSYTTSYAVAGVGGAKTGSTTKVKAVAVLMLLDIPLIRDADANAGGTGWYFAGGSAVAGYAGLTLYRSGDDSAFVPIDQSVEPAAFGYSTNTLANPTAPWVLDSVSTLIVRFTSGTPQSATDAELAAGANTFIVGHAAGGFEILQAKTVVANMDGTYTFSDLYRGLRGTEWVCGFWGDFSNGGNLHASGDLVLDVSIGLTRHKDGLDLLGVSRYYRGVAAGEDVTDVTSQTFTDNGNDLKPYAPKEVGGILDVDGNLIITWLRRSRFAGADGSTSTVSPLPVGEDSELYEVEILNGASVVRTISNLTTPTAIYTPTMQTTDFGSPQTSVTVNVYQISGQVGRGFKGHGTCPSTPHAPEVLPDGGDAYINGA